MSGRRSIRGSALHATGLVLLVVGEVSGCAPSSAAGECTEIAVTGSSIRIEAKDASSGAAICNLTVSGSPGAAGASGSGTVACVDYQCGCNIPVAVGDVPGASINYSFTIAHQGYTPVAVSGVSVLGSDGCHVAPGAPVVVALSRK